ncbi:MAG: YncE family protein [Candidatus Andeanibacterium colombiense]|uniref:YncE family protein n=1 Tax=Candidatus Andeanibacterium colombiense TaxID=3121345 RepID=A0AAJ6BMK5_9SPHN|nr:MAG: YncE family protein [Sphingomonadaceae bacterium]
MRFSWLMLAALAGTCGWTPANAGEPEKQVIQVPGFANFAEIDPRDDTVWINNEAKVEHWSTGGKLGEIVMGKPCGAMFIVGANLWAADCADGTLNRIDTATLKITASVTTGLASRGEFNVAYGAGSLWVPSKSEGVISRVDPETLKIVATIPVDPDTWYLVYGYGALWAASSTHNSLQRIDPATNTVTHKTITGEQPGFLAVGEGGVWVQNQGDGTVARVDPATGEVNGKVKIGDKLKWGEVTAGGGKIWLRTTEDQMFVVIDPKTLAIRARIGPQIGSGALRYVDAGLWTTEHDIQTMTWWPHPETIGN